MIKYVLITARLTWNDAKQACIDMGARLMELRTQDEFDRALQFRLDLGTLWLGGTDSGTENNWRWISNNDPINWSSQYWLNGGPYHNRYDLNCLAMQYASDTGIYDWFCNVSHSVACELP